MNVPQCVLERLSVPSKYPHVLCSAVLFRPVTVLGPDGEPKEVTACMSIPGFHGRCIALPELPDGQIWRECTEGDYLEPGDIYLNKDDCWEHTHVVDFPCSSHPISLRNSYFRKESEALPETIRKQLAEDGWRVVEPGESLESGDVYFTPSGDLVTVRLPADPGCRRYTFTQPCYRRVPDETLSPLAEGWRAVPKGSAIQRGDVYYHASLNVWLPARCVGDKVAGNLYFRKDTK